MKPQAAGRAPPSEALAALASGDERDLRSLQIKLTYVGSQKKPVPSVVIMTTHHLAVLDWFLDLQTDGLRYENDTTALLNFTVSPREMKGIVAALSAMGDALGRSDAASAALSLMAALRDSRLGSISAEALLDRQTAAAVIDALAAALDAQNGVGRAVLDAQRGAAFPDIGAAKP
ncbi:hypothetical protein [Sorangium sp. So ce131]|uniref:hypothetical protein n=1 Tax=Sorangium sp. So ce131 TaxID=3133282 RepID=UPI003F60CBAA